MKLIIFAVVFLSYTQVMAWGPLGHKAVGEIADRHLCEPARLKVSMALEGSTLADASIWADQVRSQKEYKFLKSWHYVSVEKGETYSKSAQNPQGDTVTAIVGLTAILKNGTQAELSEAIKLLAHFVGDAHQPLHAGASSDRGGNRRRVLFLGRNSNLHKVWDSGLLNILGLSYVELADSLDQGAAPSLTQAAPDVWVNESSKIASQVYPDEGQDELGRAYYDLHIETVRSQILIAGYRLAGLLNEGLGCSN